MLEALSHKQGAIVFTNHSGSNFISLSVSKYEVQPKQNQHVSSMPFPPF